MNSYLAQHPELGMCPRKETHYFADDLAERMAQRRRRNPRAEEDYLELFADLQDRRRLGEASVWYLYSREAPHLINRFCPAAEAIVMLRNPVKMLHSLHSQFVFVGLEPEEDFEAALALDDERQRSGAPKGFPPHSYRSVVRYAEQIERYLHVLGRDRVHIILYENFREDTLGAFRGACEFLGVDSGFEPEIEVVNPNTEVRSRLLRKLVRTPPERLRPLLHTATPQRLRRRVGLRLNDLNTRVTEREGFPDRLGAALRPAVEQQVAELRSLIDLDVSHWLDELQA